jgi:predicted Zn-dependent peptidase
VEGVIAEELARIAKEGPTPAEMERVRNQTRKGYLGSLEELQDRALTLNRFWYTTGNPGDAAGQLDRYAAVTAAGIQAAAQQLNRERLATVRIRPVAGEK